ncbi:MAG: porin family protein [Bacteroidota bacterium]
MSFEEEFDNIIRQKTDEAGFSFDEKNWEKMSQKLDEQRRGAGFIQRNKAYVAIVLLLVATFTTVLIYTTIETPDAALAVTSPLVETVSPANNPGSKEPALEKPRAGETPESPVKQTVSPDPEKIPVKENTNATRSQKAPASETDKGVTYASAVNPPNNLRLSKQKKENDVASEISMTKKAKASVVNETITEKPQEPEALLNKDENTIAASTPAKIIGASPAVVQPANSPVENTETGSGISDISEEAKEVVGLNQVESLKMINTPLPLSPDEKDILPATISEPKFYDEDYYKKEKYKTHFLNLEGGTTYLFGWQSKKGTDGKGFNWYGGINYGIYLSKKVTLSAGLQAYNISNINQAFYTTSQTEYGFSAVQNYTVITAHSLYYASLPVKFAYAFNPQNQLGLGFNMGYLVNASNTIETYNTSESGKSVPVKTKKTGAYEGIAPNNLLLSAFYKTQVSKRLALNGEFVYGLTDLFNNTPTNKNTESAMGFKISLQYTLFDK